MLPLSALALALAVGDTRLAVQAAALVAGSTILVVTIAALLTLVLPFHSVTAGIASRTRPTTLDLVIAGCSGLAGAIVSVARGNRLAGAVPGVAVAVALVPPLGVAGFGVGIGWNLDLISGSLLIYAANLAGIVVSGMIVFLIVGMADSRMRGAARDRHQCRHIEVVQRFHTHGIFDGGLARRRRAGFSRAATGSSGNGRYGPKPTKPGENLLQPATSDRST